MSKMLKCYSTEQKKSEKKERIYMYRNRDIQKFKQWKKQNVTLILVYENK